MRRRSGAQSAGRLGAPGAHELLDAVATSRPRRGADLPSSTANAPILGVKLASIGLRRPYDLATAHYVGIRRPYLGPHECREGGLCYEQGSHAVCDVGMDHAVPDESCQCGFYAFRPGATIAGHLEPGGGQWRLEVLLSGKVVVHEDGYRAERQHVVRVVPPLRCGCQRGSPTIVVVNGRDVAAMCICCAARSVSGHGALAISVDALQLSLGVPVERGHLAQDWLELLESGLITRQADPSVPTLLRAPVTLRLKGLYGSRRAEISTDRSDVLGRWLAAVVEENLLVEGTEVELAS